MSNAAFCFLQTAFLNVLNTGFVAAWMTLAVIFLRFVLKKAPKKLFCFLWLLVGVRMICPFSFESVLSLVPSSDVIKTDPSFYSGAVSGHVVTTGIGELNYAVNSVVSSAITAANERNTFSVTAVASIVWLCGIAVILLYAVVSCLLLKRRVRVSVKYEKGVYFCDNIDSPFILGALFPKIYLPSKLSDEQRLFALAHEKAHLKRRDNLWKPLAFLLLAVYWFDPLCVISYILVCRDIELACDEAVIRNFDLQKKKDYSQSLLDLSCERRGIRACPLAFGEVGVKERIKNVLSYKRPAFWIIAAALVSCVAVAVCFGTNPIKQEALAENSDVRIIETESGQSDVSLSFSSAEIDSSNILHLTLLWKNKSNKDVVCGEDFDLYYFNEENQSFEKLQKFKSSFFSSVGHVVEKKKGAFPGELSRVLSPTAVYDMSRTGRYRFVTAFNYSDDSSKQYEACVTFELKKPSAVVETAAMSNDYDLQGGDQTLKIKDAVELSKKSNLSLADFSNYAYFEIGSGISIKCYPIDGMFSVHIGSVDLEKPKYITLSCDFGSVDLKSADVESFVSQMRALADTVDNEVKEYFLKHGTVQITDRTNIGFAYSVLDCKVQEDKTVVYLKTMAGAYALFYGVEDVRAQYECVPAVITLKKEQDNAYVTEKYEVPNDENYNAQIKRLFPADLADGLIAERDYSDELNSACRESAWRFFFAAEYKYGNEPEFTLKLDENGVFVLFVQSKGERFSFSGTYKESGNVLTLTDVQGQKLTFEKNVSSLIYDESRSSLFGSSGENRVSLRDGAVFAVRRDVPEG